MTKTRTSRYIKGEHKVVCDLCGLVFLRSETKMQWDNLLACRECYSPKHPQDTIRPKTDRQTVDIARPEPENDSDFTWYVPTPDEL